MYLNRKYRHTTMTISNSETEKPSSPAWTNGLKKISCATVVKLNTLQAMNTAHGKDRTPSCGTSTRLRKSYSHVTSMKAPRFLDESGSEGLACRYCSLRSFT